MKRTLLFILFTLISVSNIFSRNIPVTPPENVHPRLLFTAGKLPQIQKTFSHPENLASYEESEKLLSEYLGKDTGFTPVKKKTFRWSGKLVAAIEASAFKYAVTHEKKYIDWAYKTFINCCRTIDLTGIYDDYRPYGQMILTAAEIYDWGYDSLSKKQKDELYNQTVSFLKKLQIGYPPKKGKAVAGHSAESQLLRSYLSAAIAMYDEHKDLWHMTTEWFYREFVPARKFFYESRSPNFQGTGYGPYRALFDLWSSLLITQMNAPEPYEGRLSLWSRYFIYNRRPDKMTWHIGDDHAIEKMNYNNFRYGANAFLNSVITKDPYAKFFAKENLGDFKKFKYNDNGENDDVLTPVQFLILNDVNLTPLDYKSLPSVYYAPFPLGEYFAASSWKENAAAVHLKIGEYTQANHEHQDSGSFEIYCNGLLAATSGYYVSGFGKDSNGGYKGEHTQKYYHSSVSKNTLLLQSDAETYEGYGLQKRLPEAKSFENLLSDENYHRAKITAHFDSLKDGKGIVFLSGDISNAYEGKNSVHRSMLCCFTGDEEKPILFFVYDRIDSKKKGIFVLNSLTEPQIQKNEVLIQNRNEKSGLKNTTLLPLNPEITKTGGKGHEWEIAGKNYSNGSETAVTQKSESGWGRIEISDSSRKSGRQVLFNAMEIFSDGESSSKEKIRLVQTQKFDFAVTEGFVVGFYKISDSKTEDYKIILSEKDFPKNTKLILCGLPAGKWNLNGKTYEVTEENRILVSR